MFGACYYIDDTDIITSSVSGASAHILGMVVEAYLTYGKNDSNGAVKQTLINLYNTWFKNKSATDEELKSQKIMDYTGYTANGNSYEGLEKNSYFSVNEKWNTMCSQVGIDPKTGKERNAFLDWFTDKKIIVIAIGGVALMCAGFAAFIIIKKRKERD